MTLFTALLLHAGILFAGNETTSTSTVNQPATISLTLLAPATPAEATFEEINPGMLDFTFLAPVMPVNADFTDVAPVASMSLTKLAPVTPVVADFE